MKNIPFVFWTRCSFFISWSFIFFSPQIHAMTAIPHQILFRIALVFFCLSFLGIRSEFKRARKIYKKFSDHSDADVAALVNGDIDITEYRKRKDMPKADIGSYEVR